jgi:DNA ligase-associated metallophosphoesterase
VSIQVQWQGHDWVLLPEKAVFWPAQSTLLVADLHLGKDATFRAAGVPIPVGSSQETLNRLAKLIAKIKPRKVVVLGDLHHGKESDPSLFNQWASDHRETTIELIAGNHDRWIKECRLNFASEPSQDAGGIMLAHAPQESAKPVICGHIHPGFRLEAGIRSETLGCFWLQPTCFVLPAFGEFTGLYSVQPNRGDQVFVIAGNQVLRVPIF